MSIWPWKTTEQRASEHPKAPPLPEPKVENPKDQRAELEEKKALMLAIEAELERMKAQAAEEIEKPAGPYRIVKVEGVSGPGGYRVQAWQVKQDYWNLRGRGHGCWDWYALTRISRWYMDADRVELECVNNALSWESVPEKSTWIYWQDVGSANPHATYEDAAEWLRKWLRPECDEVLFDADGQPIEAQ